ncbi:MAG: MFS transporter [Rhodobacteraceae bacterium]|nr:MFS transporter [Paracoccaceae bacterium]MCF8516112.1 MFS transporter [Paracoccaceae bacterium]MCF8520563.1 MFS transporter [Paracoccaceae bacterium]
MRAGIAALVVAYVLSQFYRAHLAVLAPFLEADIGATAQDLASASGYWFLTFALMQLPIGSALDRIGPRRTSAALLSVGAVGAGIFAMAAGPTAIKVAMALIGIGCAPVLMASYYLFARSYSPAVFGTLAGVVIGVGSLGNIAASLPLSAAATAFGWRETVWALAAVTLATAICIALLVRDPVRQGGPSQSSILDLLRIKALWPMLIMMAACYAPAAGLRGLWAGPYLSDVFGADAAGIGKVTLIMGLAMVAGNIAYGPLDRLLGTRKWLVVGGNTLVFCVFTLLALFPELGGWRTIALFAAAGLFGASYPMVMAHGRAFLPQHLMGRGVTLLNLFGIGTAGLMQLATGRIHAAFAPSTTGAGAPTAAYTAVFTAYAGLIIAGLCVYLFSKDRTD